MMEYKNVSSGGNKSKSSNTKHHNEKISLVSLVFSFLMFTPYSYSGFLNFVEEFNKVVLSKYKHLLVISDDGLYIVTRKYQGDVIEIDTIDDFVYLKSKIETLNSNTNVILFKLRMIDVKPVCLFKRCNLFKVKNLYRYYVEFTIVNHDFQHMKLREIVDSIIKPNIGYIYSYTKHLIKENFHGYPFWFKPEWNEKV